MENPEYPLFLINDFADVNDINGFMGWWHTLDTEMGIEWLGRMLGYGSKYPEDGYLLRMSNSFKPPNILTEFISNCLSTYHVVTCGDELNSVLSDSLAVNNDATVQFVFGWYSNNDNWRKFYG